MRICFTTGGWRDFGIWLERDPASARKVLTLLTEILRTPRDGRGHPERLKHQAHTEVWSRRVAREHRLVYLIFDDEIVVVSMRGHYSVDLAFEIRNTSRRERDE